MILIMQRLKLLQIRSEKWKSRPWSSSRFFHFETSIFVVIEHMLTCCDSLHLLHILCPWHHGDDFVVWCNHAMVLSTPKSVICFVHWWKQNKPFFLSTFFYLHVNSVKRKCRHCHFPILFGCQFCRGLRTLVDVHCTLWWHTQHFECGELTWGHRHCLESPANPDCSFLSRADHVAGEWGFVILSFSTKTLLAWIGFGGVCRWC